MTPHCLSAMISVVIGTLRAFAGGESICQRLSMEGVLRGSFLPMAYKVIIREVLEKEILVDETEAKSEREAIAIVRDRYRKEEIILYPEDLAETTIQCGEMKTKKGFIILPIGNFCACPSTKSSLNSIVF